MKDHGEASYVKQAYSPHIDGLRAIAILLVVVYHGFPEFLSGGLIGVDVFFVISGYLITNVILSNIRNGTFSFVGFYKRRILRIFPGLLLVLAACAVAGWYRMLPYEYGMTGKHMAAGAGFVSNLIFWGESGYFDIASEKKPLLHLWSLGVEEQFYIFYPILLWALWKRRLNPFLAILAVAMVSFGWNIVWHKSRPVADFYSPQTRVWELMIGGLVAYASLFGQGLPECLSRCLRPLRERALPLSARLRLTDGHVADVLSVFALAMIVYASFRVSKNTLFPGWWGILPTFGAALLVSARKDSWVSSRILASKPFVWVGLISYPLYLWHWPLLSFGRVLYGEVPPRICGRGCAWPPYFSPG